MHFLNILGVSFYSIAGQVRNMGLSMAEQASLKKVAFYS